MSECEARATHSQRGSCGHSRGCSGRRRLSQPYCRWFAYRRSRPAACRPRFAYRRSRPAACRPRFAYRRSRPGSPAREEEERERRRKQEWRLAAEGHQAVSQPVAFLVVVFIIVIGWIVPHLIPPLIGSFHSATGRAQRDERRIHRSFR